MPNKKSTSDVLFEKIPPILAWGLLTLPLWGGFLFPEVTAFVIIFFNLYFLYKSSTVAFYFLITLLEIRNSESINWLTRLKELDNIDLAITHLSEKLSLLEHYPQTVLAERKQSSKLFALKKRIPQVFNRLSERIEISKIKGFINDEVKRLREIKRKGLFFDWNQIEHVVIIPHWKEPLGVLEDSLIKLKEANYPHGHISVILAAEARDEQGIKNSEFLKAKYQQYFGHFWVSQHELAEGELIGKSSNMAAAGKFLSKEITKLGWDSKKVTVTSCDADSQLPSDYFSNVTYLYVTQPDSFYKYYTGAILFYANVWHLKFISRVLNSMSTVYNVSRLIRTDKLVPFSTYTLSLWMVEEIDYWSPNVTPEDFHTFFKGLLKFPDKVSCVPVYQKIFADAAEGETFMDTVKNNYFQERRWSWGVSDDGWVLEQVVLKILHGEFNLKLIYISLHVLYEHILTVTLTFIILLGANIPLLVNPAFAHTAFGLNLPLVSSFIIQMTLYFFIIIILLDNYLKPAEEGVGIVKRIFSSLEWFVQPFTSIFLIALPGIEAHTRLLFGKYLEYYLTKKK